MITGINFLQGLLDQPDKKMSYSVVNTARSALSAIIKLPEGGKFGEHSYVRSFMRGVFNINPPKPRYSEIWDAEEVLNLLRTWVPVRKISMKHLTLKLVMLILLVTGQRPQIIQNLNVDNMEIHEKYYMFTLSNSQVKQGRPGYKPERVHFL